MSQSTQPSGNEAETAQKTFFLNNNVETIGENDAIYHYDQEKTRSILDAKPWKKDPHHFKRVRISAVALIKMVMHARSGGAYEIMGLMQGKIDGDSIIVMDAFALPVIGTETRVNAQNEANEFMIQYIESSTPIGRLEHIAGWYHSHPGYGCWLSGIDVQTQMTHQEFEDPFLAIVIDPNRTVSAGRVDIGAFRTFPKDYTPPNSAANDFQSIPLSKIEDFGVHASSYYSLEVTYFKSERDEQILNLLWNKYWVMTLSQSPLVMNHTYMTAQLADLVDKVAKSKASTHTHCGVEQLSTLLGKKIKEEDQSADGNPLTSAVNEGLKYSDTLSQGLIGQFVKDAVFNNSRLTQEDDELSQESRAFHLPAIVP